MDEIRHVDDFPSWAQKQKQKEKGPEGADGITQSDGIQIFVPYKNRTYDTQRNNNHSVTAPTVPTLGQKVT